MGLAVPVTISLISALPPEKMGKTSSLLWATVPLFMFYVFWHAFPSFCFSDRDQLQGQPEFHLFQEIFLNDSGPLDLLFFQCWLTLTQDVALGYRLSSISLSHLTYVTSVSSARRKAGCLRDKIPCLPWVSLHNSKHDAGYVILYDVLRLHVWVWWTWVIKRSSPLRERRPLKNVFENIF